MSLYRPPGSTIGILGGGQLGRMLTLAARRMGYRTISWIGGPDTGPAALSNSIIEDPFDSPEGLARFLEMADVATVEFENIPSALLDTIESALPLHPSAEAVSICQHREREKNFLSANGFPCARFRVVESAESLREAFAELPAGSGGILKTAEFGYDGKGQLSVNSTDDAEAVWRDFASGRAVLEEKIDLAGELSVLVVRDTEGNVACYDPVENHHRDHILDVSIVPARFEAGLLGAADETARGIADALNYVGILAVEFFVSQEGRLLVNEMAPRPHNSGHHTIDACETSQFEQQLRCLTGLPIGSTRLHSHTVMLNLLGDVWLDNQGSPAWDRLLALSGTTLHLYGKSEPRKGRKMGHLTVTGNSAKMVLDVHRKAREILGIPKFKES